MFTSQRPQLPYRKKISIQSIASYTPYRTRGNMIPETKAFCPRGLGMVPYLMPSGVELAEATIKAIDDDYDVVMWEKHGVFAVDTDIMSAFDQIDVLNKAALIYIASKNMGFEPEGMSDAQMQELTETFNLPK